MLDEEDQEDQEESVSSKEHIQDAFKGATKLYFMYCSRVVIIFLSPRLCKSAFSTYFLVKLVFRLFLF